MNILFILIIFIISIIVYLHFVNYFKQNNDFNIFKIINPLNEEINEICKKKTPFLIEITDKNEYILDLSKSDENIKEDSENINLFDFINSKFSLSSLADIKNSTKLKFIDLSNNNVIISLEEIETKDEIFSNNNEDFLNSNNLINNISYFKNILSNPILFFHKYDLLIGTKAYITEINCPIFERNYYYVVEGEIEIKLLNPNNKKLLNKIEKFNNNNIFKKALWEYNHMDEEIKNSKKKIFLKKLNFIDLKLEKGDIIYIPPRWFFTIKFNSLSILINLNYNSIIGKIGNFTEHYYNKNISYIKNNLS